MMQVQSSEASVIVSWDRVDIAIAANYTVYYNGQGKELNNEMSVTVPSTENSVTIAGLVTGEEYEFQVALSVGILGEGTRSEASAESRINISAPSKYGGIDTKLKLLYVVTNQTVYR